MKPARGIHVVEELSQIGYLLRKVMDGKIKSTGDFWFDLGLAICFPKIESEDQLVRFILGPFREQHITKWEKPWESWLSKLPLPELNAVNNEARSHIEKCWKGISAGLCIIERFGYILSKEFFYFCRHIIDKLVDESLATLAFNNMSGIGRGGTGVLKMDGKEVASQKMEHTIPLILQWDETFDIGADAGTPVDDKDYQVPFKFSGELNKLTLTVDRPKLTPADEKMLMEQSQRNNKTSE